MKTILVTGGLGFIGHHLVKELIYHGDSVVVVDDFSNINKRFLEELKKNRKIRENVLLCKLDIRDSKALASTLEGKVIDICIHLAAKTSIRDSITRPHETLDVNVMGTLNVLEACCNNNINNFIFASSAAVYGNPETLPITEEHALHPISTYGASKAAGEALVSSCKSRIKNCSILRFFNVYGNGQTQAYAGVITKFTERLVNRLPPTIHGSGNQTRDFIHISDVVQAIIAVMKGNIYDAPTEKPGIFNIGTGNPTSIQDLAYLMIDFFGLERSIHPLYSDPITGDVMHSYADIKKAKSELAFSPKQALRAGLNLYLDHETCDKKDDIQDVSFLHPGPCKKY